MGLLTLPGTEIQYFSFSEEIQAVGVKFFEFIVNISYGWVITVLGFSVVFIVAGILYRMAKEIDEADI